MHHVLRAAIENPRFARPYGSDRGDNGFSDMGTMAVDGYMKSRISQWDGNAANDNYKLPAAAIIGLYA
jgi:hypothetical protein